MQSGRETSSSLLTLNVRRCFFKKKKNRSFAIILAIFIAYIKHNTGWFSPEKITTELLRWTDSYWRPWPAWWGVSTGNWKQEKYRASHRASSDIRAQGTGILICPQGPLLQGYLSPLIHQHLPTSVLPDQSVWKGGWDVDLLSRLSLKPPWKALLSPSSSCLP